jgi:hypothetical protein
MAEALGVSMMSAPLTKRSGCVSAGIPLIAAAADSIGLHETSNTRHRLTCGGCGTLCDARRLPSSCASAAVPEARSEPGGKSARVKLAKNSKRAKLVGSPSESGPIVDRCGFFSLGPISAARAAIKIS